jgi:UDP-N-acetylglucosamine:LPS N-acetylglucosamine transferase
MIPQQDLDGDRLARAVLDLVNDPGRQRDMSGRMRAFSVPDAAARIVDAMQRAGLLRDR